MISLMFLRQRLKLAKHGTSLITPRSSDGTLGVMQTSPTVTIRGNTAPVTGVPTLDSTNGGTDYDDEELIATAAATTDADSDATTNIFHWIKNGVSQTNLQMPFDTEVPTSPQHKRSCKRLLRLQQ